MVKLLLAYISEVYCFAKVKLIINLLLNVILGLVEGVSVIMLLPLLEFAGITGNRSSGLGQMVEQHVSFSGIALHIVLLVYTGIIIGQSWLQRYEAIMSSTIVETFDSYLGTSLYRSLAYARWSFFLQEKRADIAHIVMSERIRASAGSYYLLQLSATGILAVIQLGIAFTIAPYLTILVMCCGVILFCCLHFIVKETRRMGRNISSYTGSLFNEVNEHLNGIKEVKSYGLEALQVRNFESQCNKVQKAFIELAKLQSKTAMLYKVGAAVFISIFFYSAIEIVHANPQDLLVVFVIFTRLWPRLASFQGGLQSLVGMLPAFQAVTELRERCRTEGEQMLLPDSNDRLRIQEGIKLDRVSFRYPNTEQYAVKQAKLFLPVGTTTAVVGMSGAGKSTLSDLILGLLLPEQGKIIIDNKQLDSDNRYLWRKSVGYVPQDSFLFNTSIRENLIWASPDVTENELWKALQLAAVDKFVQGLPEKLDTVVGDRGVRLSGGERQRIVLARALLRKPELLILDEATSSLDTENERRIQQAIEGLRGKLTILIIAHRISTVKNADQILVMEKGSIVEQGTYQSFAVNYNSRFYKLACL